MNLDAHHFTFPLLRDPRKTRFRYRRAAVATSFGLEILWGVGRPTGLLHGSAIG